MPNISLTEVMVGDNISFTLHGPVSGNIAFTGKVISKLSAEGIPPTSTAAADHVNIYRDLPSEVQAVIEDDYASYNYLAVKNENGVFYIGEPWIALGTLVLDNVGVATITLGDFRDSDSLQLRQLLESNGYTVNGISISG